MSECVLRQNANRDMATFVHFYRFFGHRLHISTYIELQNAGNIQFKDKNQIKFVSFKNVHIWPSYGQKMVHMPTFGHTFFGHNSAISGPIWLKIFMGVEETIIYRSVIQVTVLISHF